MGDTEAATRGTLDPSHWPSGGARPRVFTVIAGLRIIAAASIAGITREVDGADAHLADAVSHPFRRRGVGYCCALWNARTRTAPASAWRI